MKYKLLGVTIGALYCVWQEKKRSDKLSEMDVDECLSFLSHVKREEETEKEWTWKLEDKGSYVRTRIIWGNDIVYTALHTKEKNETFQTKYVQSEYREEDTLLLTRKVEKILSQFVSPSPVSLLLYEEEVKRKLKTHLRILKKRG